jgi:hypothetical protein
MALIVEDRILETSTSTGTGDFTLAGALLGYKAFSAVCATNDTFYYMIEAIDANGAPTGDWESGLGTYSASNTLTRTTVSRSSNSNAAVSFAAGTKRVSISSVAQYLQLLTNYEAGPITAPTAADFTQLNFGTSTATDGTGALLFSPQIGDPAPRYLVKSSPAGSFDLYARIEMATSTTSSTAPIQHNFGIVLRNSSNNEVVSFEQAAQRPGVSPFNFWYHLAFRVNGTNSGTYGTNYLAAIYDMKNWPWMRLGYNSATGVCTFYKSPDGKNWISLGTATVGTNLGTPDQIGLLARAITVNVTATAFISYFSMTAPR